MPDRDFVLSLAPTDLPIERDERFRGGGHAVSMDDLHPEDRERGYVGGALDGSRYYAWFQWPSYV